jgi:hypothetical protein
VAGSLSVLALCEAGLARVYFDLYDDDTEAGKI